MPPSLTAEVPRPPGLVLDPFRAVRYDAGRFPDLGALTSPPYDVIDAEERRALAGRSPYNVVRLILPEDRPGEPGSRYAEAARTLRDWRRQGVLRRDDEPALYVYEERSGDHVQRGLVGLVRLAQPGEGVVLPHENTMAGPVADRLALTTATEANLEPIFLVYDGGGAASAAVRTVDERPPLLAADTDDGVTHRVWALADRELLDAVAADLRPRRAVIADGHHRYATYLEYQRQRHAAGGGDGPWDLGLAFLVDAREFGPQVEPIHRVVPNLRVEDAVGAAGRVFRTTRVDPDEALRQLAATPSPAFLLVGDGQWWLLADPDPGAIAAAVPPDRSPAWRSLDVTVAHAVLVAELWRLADREDTVGFAHDVDEALARAGDGTALLLKPTPVAAVAAVAAAGDRMPRKSTLFLPKPRTGLLMRVLGDSASVH